MNRHMKVLSKLVTPAALILLVLVSGTTLAQTSGDYIMIEVWADHCAQCGIMTNEVS